MGTLSTRRIAGVMMPSPVLRPRVLAGFVLALAFTIAAYYPALRGGFIFDDLSNIVLNPWLHVNSITIPGLRQAAFSVDSGTLKRPVSMLSFWANYYATGLDPYYFKVTNLVIHLLNGLALFWLTRLLLDAPGLRKHRTEASRDWIALAATVIWLVHPLNVTGVAYVVQRMTSLCAMFVIFGLICYVIGRERLTRGASGYSIILLGLIGFGGLATLSKENGALLPVYMAAIELTLFRFSGLSAGGAKKLKTFFALTAALPLIGAALFLTFFPSWLVSHYQIRDFTLAERLMTEARVLWLYLRWAIIPTAGSLGLFHDDIAVSHGLFQPISTILALVALLAVVGVAVRFRKEAPLIAFATFWYLGGHLLESSVIPLELVFEHRNYLPLYGPLVAAVCATGHALRNVPLRARVAVPVAFAMAFGTVTLGRSVDWKDSYSLRMALVRNHPNSPRSNYEAAAALGALAIKFPALSSLYYPQIKRYLERSISLDPNAVNGLFGLMLLNANNHLPIAQENIDELVERLSKAPLTFTVVGAFRSFSDWTTKKIVDLPRETVVRIYEAALGNPTTEPRTKGQLLSLLSGYYGNIVLDAQEAVSLAMAAVEQDPAEPAFHLSLADLATKLGNFDLAARELIAADQNDPLGRFGKKTRDLETSLRLAQAEHVE